MWVRWGREEGGAPKDSNLLTHNLPWHNPITQPAIGPFSQWPDQSSTAGPAASPGTTGPLLDFPRRSSRGGSPPIPTTAIVLAPPPAPGVCRLSPHSFSCLPPVSISPPHPLLRSPPLPSLSLLPLATVTAFSLDDAAPHLAVRSARPRQSCQFTCLECRILPPCPPEPAAITIPA